MRGNNNPQVANEQKRDDRGTLLRKEEEENQDKALKRVEKVAEL